LCCTKVVQQHPSTISRGVWVPAFARTTMWGHSFAFPRRDAPEFCCARSALTLRGRRECRARGAPAAARGVVVNTRVSHHGHTGTPGIPRAMVLTVSFVLSPVIGLSCHRRLRTKIRKLDASVEASGPHDFAVRFTRHSSKAHSASTASRSNVRDDRETPLCGTGWNQNITVSTPPST